MSDPIPGHYKTRLTKRGPWLPVTIWIERDRVCGVCREINAASALVCRWCAIPLATPVREHLHCLIDGTAHNPDLKWPSVAGHPIDEAEYRHLSRLRDWAERHSPDDPYASAREPVDLNKADPIF